MNQNMEPNHNVKMFVKNVWMRTRWPLGEAQTF